MSNDAFMLGADSQATQREEAERSGASSFRGILLLISELEYFSLVERLCRLPITERQLTTSRRLWTLTKGAVLGGIGTTTMFFAHICVSLLAATFSWPESIRIMLIGSIFASGIYGINNYLLGKLVFADSAASKLKELMMLGFIAHIIFVKFSLCILPWFLSHMNVDVGRLICQHFNVLYPFYVQIKLPSGVEWILFAPVIGACILSVLRNRDVTGHMRTIQNGERPYDLMSSGS